MVSIALSPSSLTIQVQILLRSNLRLSYQFLCHLVLVWLCLYLVLSWLKTINDFFSSPRYLESIQCYDAIIVHIVLYGTVYLATLKPWNITSFTLLSICVIYSWTALNPKKYFVYLPSIGQSYKGFTIINYDSRFVPDLKIPHITTLES